MSSSNVSNPETLKRLCLGTVQLGQNYGIANEAGKPSFETALTIIRLARREKIQFFDTAQAYGDSETVLGKAWLESGGGEPPYWITKLDPAFEFRTPAELDRQIDLSCERLQTQRLWGLLLHRPRIAGDAEGFYRAIAENKTQGRITHFGASVYSVKEAFELARRPEVSVLQIPWNVLDRGWLDEGFFEFARERKITLLVRSVYLQGLLLLSSEQARSRGMDWADPWVSKVRRFAQEAGVGIKEFCLRGVLDTNSDIIPVVGVEREDQLAEISRIVAGPPLSKELLSTWWKQLEAAPEKLLNPALWRKDS